MWDKFQELIPLIGGMLTVSIFPAIILAVWFDDNTFWINTTLTIVVLIVFIKLLEND